MLRYQRPLQPCIFSHCDNIAHGYINRPFVCASNLAAILSTSLKYRLVDKTKHSQPCLSVLDARASRWAGRRRRVTTRTTGARSSQSDPQQFDYRGHGSTAGPTGISFVRGARFTTCEDESEGGAGALGGGGVVVFGAGRYLH